LDLACGTGRYAGLLSGGNAERVVAADFCEPMLGQVSGASRVRANMMQLPFVSGAFDVVVCGLALSHATSVGAWMIEIARVLDENGCLLYSDFHSEAARAGLTRSFKDQDGRTCTVPHRCYTPDEQCQAATAAGLTVEAVHEVRVGIELVEAFPGSEDFYSRWSGLPIALIVRARK
jgi:malonyl-CoA O-methyltransferase